MRGMGIVFGALLGIIIGFIPALVSDLPEPLMYFCLYSTGGFGLVAGWAVDTALKYKNEVKELLEHNNKRWEEIDRLECEKYDLEKEVKRYKKREKRNRKFAIKLGSALMSSGLGMLGNLFNSEPEPEPEPESEFEPEETEPETE